MAPAGASLMVSAAEGTVPGGWSVMVWWLWVTNSRSGQLMATSLGKTWEEAIEDQRS